MWLVDFLKVFSLVGFAGALALSGILVWAMAMVHRV
jgi:hypothetical protein